MGKHKQSCPLSIPFPFTPIGPRCTCKSDAHPEPAAGEATAIENLRSVILDWEGSQGRPDLQAHRSLALLECALRALRADLAAARDNAALADRHFTEAQREIGRLRAALAGKAPATTDSGEPPRGG